jgi:CopG antitoxin of type II toxin-antitoxin system
MADLCVISARDMHRKQKMIHAKDRESPKRGKHVRAALKSIPVFSSQAQERKFWETHDSTEYLDWTRAQSVRLPDLEPTSEKKASS